MSYFGQIATVTAPLQSTAEGGLLSTVTANTLNPSQTMTYLDTTQSVIGNKVYTKKVLPRVGQPYELHMSDADVYKEVYKTLPVKARVDPIAGAEPQRVMTLKSGLEIPEELLERDIARKKAEAMETELLLTQRPSKLLQIGHFASSNPLQASLIALAIGAALGSYFYNSQH